MQGTETVAIKMIIVETRIFGTDCNLHRALALAEASLVGDASPTLNSCCP